MLSAAPIGHDLFARLMAPLGPWPPDRRVAVAVSGGPDSLALAVLVRAWAAERGSRPLALVVDHGLRAGSAAEARHAVDAAARLGCEARLLTLGVRPGPGLQARARASRLDALEAAAAASGCLDLVLAHHRDDQAETVAIRAEGGSGPDGLAGMAAVVEREACRLVRPLLGVTRARLRATCDAAGLVPIDDPSNADPRFARGRLRAAGGAPPPDPARARLRAARERDTAAFLARHAMLDERGFATLDVDAVPPFVLARLLRTVGGRHYAPGREAVLRLAGALHPATVGGVRVARAPCRLGGRWVLGREPEAMAAPVAAVAGAAWDGRFRLASGLPGTDASRRGAPDEGCSGAPVATHAGATGFGALGAVRFGALVAISLGALGALSLGALGAVRLGALGATGAARRRTREGLPAAILATLPAFLDPDGMPVLVPHLDGGPRHNFPVILSPPVPVGPSFFMIERHLDMAQATWTAHDGGSGMA